MKMKKSIEIVQEIGHNNVMNKLKEQIVEKVLKTVEYDLIKHS